MCNSKLFKALLILIGLSLVLTGCYPTGEQNVNTDIDTYSEKPVSSSCETQIDNISTSSVQVASEPNAKYESEQYTVDLNFPANVPSQASEIELKPRYWDNNKLREIFIGDKEITSETDYKSDGFPDEKRYVVYFGENMRLTYEPMNISLECQDEISSVQSAIAGRIDGRWNDGLSNKELKSFSKSDALAQVQHIIIDKLEITNIGEPVIHSVTAQKGNELMSERNYVDKEGNEYTPPKLNDEDEFYFITYPIVYNDIELSQHLKMNADIKKSHFPSCIKAVVTKNGIVDLECSRIYEAEFEAKENVLINCGAEDALNVLNKHYTETFQMLHTTLRDCKLVYITSDVSDGQCRVLTPIWQFSGYEITEEEKNKGLEPSILHYDYVLPQTGEIYEDLF